MPWGFLVGSMSFEMEWLGIKKKQDTKVCVLLREAHAYLTASPPGVYVFGGLCREVYG